MASNTAVHIKRNRNIASMRLKNRCNQSVRKFIIEHFWIPEEWPDHIVNSLIDFRYNDRICICNFFFGNGMQLDDAFQIIAFYHNWNSSTLKHYQIQFSDLWTRIETAVKRIHDNWEHITSTYYFYSMIERAVLFFNGNLRTHGVSINIRQNVDVNRIISLPHSQYDLNETPRTNNQQSHASYISERERTERLNRRWQFLASIDNDPIIIDEREFKFDCSLYTNTI